MHTKESLSRFIQDNAADLRIVVVSNREPYVPTYTEDGISWVMPPGGLTSALDPVMRATGGVWIAQGSEDPEEEIVGRYNKIALPAEDPQYFMRRVWLSKEERDGYYYGFSNRSLWPLCHTVYVRPEFNEEHWNTYKQVNQRFADYVTEETEGEKALVFVQDYHLALLPRLIKERDPYVLSAQFWHIPWPHWEAFRSCPWGEEILDGLLGNDLLGFHTGQYCENFMFTVEKMVNATVSIERSEIVADGGLTRVLPFPISVDFEQINLEAQQQAVEDEMDRLKQELGLDGKLVGMGLDRLDYTKGIPERLDAIEDFFLRYPQYLDRVVFIQVSSSSRIAIDEYRQLAEEVGGKVDEINSRFGSNSWMPIIQLDKDASPVTIMALRRLAHFCIVSSLHDGLNLVAKEYVASRFDEDGSLILSPFAGAAQELTDAIMVNPYATKEFADTIKLTIEMPEEERRYRMRQMRRVVQGHNIYDWAVDIISEIMKVDSPRLIEVSAL